MTDLGTLRGLAEAEMVDRCTITRPATGRGAYDPTTQRYAPGAPAVRVYSGPCLLKVVRSVVQTRDVAGVAAVDVARAELHLPVLTSGNVKPGDVAHMDTGRHDPALIGQRFTITQPHLGSVTVKRRLPVEQVV